MGVFFCLSDYGLAYSDNKDKMYVRKFPRKRILPYYATYLFTVFLYMFMLVFIGQRPEGMIFVKTFFFGGTVVAHGWYLQELLVLYLLFYFCYRTATKQSFFLLSILVAIFIVLCFAIGLESYWTYSTLAFPLGILYFRCKDIQIIVDNLLWYFSSHINCIYEGEHICKWKSND